MGGFRIGELCGLQEPARIIPAIRRFINGHAGSRCRFVGEPIWPGRSVAEIREATRHEALINQAFAGAPITILCPYHTGGLGRALLQDAGRAHPHVLDDGTWRASCCYRGAGVALAIGGQPLPRPPPKAGKVVFRRRDLPFLREFAKRRGPG